MGETFGERFFHRRDDLTKVCIPKSWREVSGTNVALELVPKGFQERVWKICETLNLDRAMLRRNFTPLAVPYPSRLRQNDVLGAFIRKLKDGGYSLVILDPLYKLYEIGEDECTGIVPSCGRLTVSPWPSARVC